MFWQILGPVSSFYLGQIVEPVSFLIWQIVEPVSREIDRKVLARADARPSARLPPRTHAHEHTHSRGCGTMGQVLGGLVFGDDRQLQRYAM